jgi:UDP-glucose 4-epimerase
MSVFVVGCAGYIGSHMVKFLGRLACNVTKLDDLSSCQLNAVMYGDFVYGNIVDRILLDQLLK